MVKTPVIMTCCGCGGRYCARCSGKKGQAARWARQRVVKTRSGALDSHEGADAGGCPGGRG
jgi:hypothetical protein